jgi:hypothetical protein
MPENEEYTDEEICTAILMRQCPPPGAISLHEVPVERILGIIYGELPTPTTPETTEEALPLNKEE